MKSVEGKIRVMREELKDDPKRSNTDEIREGYDLGNTVVNITHIPANETQNPHFHLMVEETDHVLSGEMECYYNGNWSPLQERHAMVFEPGEVHNVRTREKVTKTVRYPHATENIAAVFASYKIIPPHLDIKSEEIGLVLGKDWFHERYLKNPEDKTVSPLYKLEEKLYNKFMEIANRNKTYIRDRVPEFFK